MTTSAVIMMIVAALLLWGGFITAVLHLRRSPEVPDDDQGTAPAGDSRAA